MKLEEISNEDFLTWCNLDVTKSVMQFAAECKQNILEEMGAGITLGDNAEQKTAKAAGIVFGLNLLTDAKQERLDLMEQARAKEVQDEQG